MVNYRYFSGRNILCSLLAVSFLFLTVASAQGASRLYFTGMVETNEQSGKPQVMLHWGSFEGDLPEEIEVFTLYRKESGGSFVHLADIPYEVSPDLGQLVSDDWNQRRFVEVLDLLNAISAAREPAGPVVNTKNFADMLRDIFVEGSPFYNPLQKWLFSRFNPNIARGVGLGYLDTALADGEQYTYMLTAVTAGGESLPIGQTGVIDTDVVTVLPPPEQFRQVFVGECSLYQSNLDDLRIHFTWNLPSAPQDIGLDILTYGYMIYWAEEEVDPAVVDLNTALPPSLHPINAKPIVVAGPAETSGADSFLARDDGSAHATGPAWKRGQQYYYYIARRDIGGHFSTVHPVNEAPVSVVDRQPPVAPWRVHTEELMSPPAAGVSVPGMNLVWDQVNPVNYARYFGSSRSICSARDTEVCVAASDEDCADSSKVRCVDTNAVSYDIYRFESEADAAAWGIDSDGDLWPDVIENAVAADACDPDDFPTNGPPPQKIASIDRDDTVYQRQLNDMQVQMVFHDPFFDTAQYDKVFYYKIIARDPAGNQSPASPPIRAILHNREQAEADGTLYAEECDHYFTDFDPEESSRMEQGDVLTLVDSTGDAVRWEFTAYCPKMVQQGYNIIPLASGNMINSEAHIKAEMIESASCDTQPCYGNSYVVIFYDKNNVSLVSPPPSRPLNEAGFFAVEGLCSGYNGTVTLDTYCKWVEVSTPNRVASGPVKVCAPLGEGQVARVYQKINGQMSPVANIDYESPDGSCVEFLEGGGIVTSDLCLGVRTFTENHIGSSMHYFNCLEMAPVARSSLPPAPVIEGLYSKETPEGEPYFELHWSGLLEGQTSFVIAMNDGEDSRYQTVFPAAANSSGQFSHALNLSAEDLTREWHVKIRLISTDMKRSPWSEEMSATYQLAEPEILPWPVMDERISAGTITAVLLKEESTRHRPALILSDDLTQLMSLTLCDGAICLDNLQECDGSNLCVDRIVDAETDEIYDEPSRFENVRLCSYIQPLVKIRNFIVYRQEEGKEFLQVSPLISGFTCQNESIFVPYMDHVGGVWHYYSIIRNPFYFFRKILPSAVMGHDLEGEPIDPAVATGPRMFYLDHYPSKSGMTVRYKVVLFDVAGGEPKKELTSNWLVLE